MAPVCTYGTESMDTLSSYSRRTFPALSIYPDVVVNRGLDSPASACRPATRSTQGLPSFPSSLEAAGASQIARGLTLLPRYRSLVTVSIRSSREMCLNGRDTRHFRFRE